MTSIWVTAMAISERRHIIAPGSLDQREYLLSLMSAAADLGLLGQNDILKIQSDLISLLARLSDESNGGRSTSLPADKAKELMSSAAFVIGVRLKKCPCPDDAVKLLSSSSCGILFEEGVTEIATMLAEIRQTQKHILSRLFPTPNVFWRETIKDGIDGFLRLYRPRFDAREIHITADYPVLAGRPRLYGAEFILQYLQCISSENRLLNAFDPAAVDRLLSRASRSYAETPVNLAEPVLLTALALTILGRSPMSLDLSGDDLRALRGLFLSMTPDGLRRRLNWALMSFAGKAGISGTPLQYALFSITRQSDSVASAAREDVLGALFPCRMG